MRPAAPVTQAVAGHRHDLSVGKELRDLFESLLVLGPLCDGDDHAAVRQVEVEVRNHARRAGFERDHLELAALRVPSPPKPVAVVAPGLVVRVVRIFRDEEGDLRRGDVWGDTVDMTVRVPIGGVAEAEPYDLLHSQVVAN